MPKVLTEAQVNAFEEQGYLSPVRAMSAERARRYRERYEALETRFPNDMKNIKTKSYLLCPWGLEIAEDPSILDTFEDLIGPNIRCWSMAWRVKKADGQTIAGWLAPGLGVRLPDPGGAGVLDLSSCGVQQGCRRGIPGSHRWGHLKHEESDDPRSILARGQYIVDEFWCHRRRAGRRIVAGDPVRSLHYPRPMPADIVASPVGRVISNGTCRRVSSDLAGRLVPGVPQCRQFRPGDPARSTASSISCSTPC